MAVLPLRSPGVPRSRGLVVALVATLGWSLGALPGCSSSGPAAPPGPPSGTLRVSGSGTVFPIAQALAQAYHQQNPRALFRITSDGTARGIKYAAEGVVTGLDTPLMSRAFSIPDGNTGPTLNNEMVDLGLSSRNLLPDEREAYTLAVATTVAIDGLAVAVHPSVTVANLTLAQLRSVYSGAVTNWRDVGGPDLPVYLVVRDPISGTAGAWASLVMNGMPIAMGAHSVADATGVAPAVAMNPGAVGYLSFNYLDATVHPVSVEGVAPTVANLASQTYPIRRPFVFVTAPGASALTRAFVDFTRSPAGVAVLVANGEVAPTADGGAP